MLKNPRDSIDGINRHSSEQDTGMDNRELGAEGDTMPGPSGLSLMTTPERVDIKAGAKGAKGEAEAIAHTERDACNEKGAELINPFADMDHALREIENSLFTAILKPDLEEKEPERGQAFFDERNKAIEVFDLMIHTADIELALTDVTGEGSKERKPRLDELKDGKRKLKEINGRLEDGNRQFEDSSHYKSDVDGHAASFMKR
ncbi:hypothetical protein HD806DRAFT_543687 [Xylariaceae sp. AK1471]|nr:hypothetical protein HD806DRAFT_543687 [Xylariaceae sp. AK1471]